MSEDSKTEKDTRTRVELTLEESAAFQSIIACKAACDQVVHSAVREWEAVHLADRELWRRLIKKYHLDVATHNYVLSEDGLSVRVEDRIDSLEKRNMRAMRYVDSILKPRPEVDE